MASNSEIVQMLRVLDSSCKPESITWVAQIAADAIEALLAKVPKWISVEERLPQKYESVITVDKHSHVQWNYLINEKHLTWSAGYHITHWMPLPEPPKEGN